MLRGAALLLAFVCAAGPAAAQTIWRGRSGGFDITWSASDLTARRVRDGVTVFSVRRLTEAEWRQMRGDDADEVQVREYEQRYRLLSVVGSIISVEEATYCDCGGAHPISWTRFVSYDLARGSAAHPFAVPAGQLFSERELLDGLQRDAVLRQAMDAAGAHSFSSLRQLTERLKSQEVQPRADDCTFVVGEEFPTSFAVHHLENGRTAVRFSLSHGVEVCRGMMIQLGVLAAPRPTLAADLQAASSRRAGYLMKDLVAIAGDRRTLVNFRAASR